MTFGQALQWMGERSKAHWPIMARALLALSACWSLTGAALYAWWAYRPSAELTRPRVLALLVLEAAVIYALSLLFLRPRLELVPFPEFSLEMPEDKRKDAVVNYCKYAIANYQRVYRYNFRGWRLMLTSSVVLGTAGTVLSTYQSPSRLVMIVRTVTVALTTIATTLNSSYRFQQESVRQGSTADALRGELASFFGKAKPYEQGDVSLFAANVRSIIAVESQTWVASTQAKQP